VFKRELHGFAWGLSREELRSTFEFAILAFVVYPLLPAGTVAFGSGQYAVEIEPRVVWLMVVFVAGIGILNYVIVTGSVALTTFGRTVRRSNSNSTTVRGQTRSGRQSKPSPETHHLCRRSW
jgi:uncharacterized membrane protein (DUF4010 family)